MASKKHGRCRRGIRARVGSLWRPSVARRETVAMFWKLVAEGLTSEQAGIQAGVSQAVGARWFRQGGGMPPIELIAQSQRYLSFAEREQIALLRAEGVGVREIARRLEREPSTVSRELRRNAAMRCGYVDYRATTAQWHADHRAGRPKAAKLATNPKLRKYVWRRRVDRQGQAGRAERSRLEGASARQAAGPPLGIGLEPGADRQSPSH